VYSFDTFAEKKLLWFKIITL